MVKRRIWDGAKLRARMDLLDVTPSVMAEKVGMDPATVALWRHGYEPREELRKKLAKVLGCSPDDFYSEVKP